MTRSPRVAALVATPILALTLVPGVPAVAVSGPPAGTLSPDEVGDLTIAAIGGGLAAGDFTCAELVDAYLARVDAYDQNGPGLNALITVSETARAEAEAIDAALAAGNEAGDAACVPVILKDVINTSDMPTTQGSELFADWLPEEDGTIVTALRDAGAIVLGKSNLDDFAAAVYGVSSLTGAIRNPYDLERTAGGSSGGSAVAVAAGYAPLTIGTDTGGSLRIPAALNGVVTIRPTLGLVSRDGMFPRSETQDTAGPLAATVTDAAVGLDLIAGYDPADPVTARGVGQRPEGGYAAQATGEGLDGVRIGLVTGGLAIWGDQPDGPVVALLREAAAELEALGAEVVPMEAPPGDLLGSTSVIGPESAHSVNEFLADHPAAPVASFQELYDSGSYTEYAAEAFDREILIDPEALTDNLDYQRSLATRISLQDWTLNEMAREDLDAFAYPSAAQLADLIGNEQAGLFSRWSENTGYPAISVPMGYAESDSGTMLPANIELLGRAFGEAGLIRIAHAYEASADVRVEPPLPAIEEPGAQNPEPSPTAEPSPSPEPTGDADPGAVDEDGAAGPAAPGSDVRGSAAGLPVLGTEAASLLLLAALLLSAGVAARAFGRRRAGAAGASTPPPLRG